MTYGLTRSGTHMATVGVRGLKDPDNRSIHQNFIMTFYFVENQSDARLRKIILTTYLTFLTNNRSAQDKTMDSWGALQRGPRGPWPTQNFGWVGHNAFGSTIGLHVR